MARYGTINQKTLDNTPGTDGQFLRRESGVWVPSSAVPARSQLQITSSRNLAVTDAGRHLYNFGSTDYTLTIPNNTFAPNDEIEIAADSTGLINILAGSGVTINGASAAVCYPGTAGFLKFRTSAIAQWYGGGSSSGGSPPPAPEVKQFVLYSDATFKSYQTVATHTIASILLPGGTLKPNGFLSYEVLYKGVGTGSKTFTVAISGNNFVAISGANANGIYTGKKIYNRDNSALVSVNSGAFGYSSAGGVSGMVGNINLTVDQTILVSVVVAVANQGVDLTYLSFEIVNP